MGRGGRWEEGLLAILSPTSQLISPSWGLQTQPALPAFYQHHSGASDGSSPGQPVKLKLCVSAQFVVGAQRSQLDPQPGHCDNTEPGWASTMPGSIA